jgi:hypothetical protein
VEDGDGDGEEDGYDDSLRKRKLGGDGPRGRKKRRLSSEDGTQSVCLGYDTLLISDFSCRDQSAC